MNGCFNVTAFDALLKTDCMIFKAVRLTNTSKRSRDKRGGKTEKEVLVRVSQRNDMKEEEIVADEVGEKTDYGVL